MSGPDPLKTMFSVRNRDDTSLALPSLYQHRTGQERVREQVQSVRRTKSRHYSTKSGSSSLSPTSPLNDSNGSVFFGNGYSKSYNSDRSLNSPQVFNNKGPSMRSSTAFSRYMRNYSTAGPTALGQTNSSRSEPAWNFGAPKRSIPTQRLPLNRASTQHNIYRNQQSSQSQFIRRTTSQPHPMNIPNGSVPVKTHHFKANQTDIKKSKSMTVVTDGPPKTKVSSRANGTTTAAKITMKEAVEHLSSKDENYQLFGASFIQHNTFSDEKSKEEVLKLKGIPPLVALLSSSSSKVKYTASAALRNLSFKSNANKQEICRCEGIPKIVDELKTSDSVELDKQLTGLLWNLSSVDYLKSELLKNALPVLMEHVIQPYTTGPEPANKDPDVFTHSTECLRNLSSADQNSRQTMRKCQGLIDSLATYIKTCVDKQKTDDESLESCVCILHNLTFQLEAEMPGMFSKISALAPRSRSQPQNNGSAVGCFSSQSKPSEHNPCFDYPVIEDPRPTGAGWLIHSKTLQSYLSLLKLSQQEATLEACCGAMHNLTTGKGPVSDVMSDIIVRKLNGTSVITPLLKSDKVNLQRNTVILLGNLLKNPNLHSVIGYEALPTLLDILRDAKGEDASDDTLAMACQSACTLLLNDTEKGKESLDEGLIKSLHNLSNNIYLPKSSKAAAIFLFKIWSDKDLQSFVKKNGMNKSWFVNNTTMAAYRSVQVVD